jgi:RHH-type proline utilization regulon transcriptional repressor/proline dehydrogenase/delta 1-pyrroline-5-carboxylate dehydrogenase
MGATSAGAADSVSQDPLQRLREGIRKAALAAESDAIGDMLVALNGADRKLTAAQARAGRWVEAARAQTRSQPLVETMLEQFPLDSAQGRALMSLAEALVRTPDRARADQLIAERLAELRDGQSTEAASAASRGAAALGATAKDPGAIGASGKGPGALGASAKDPRGARVKGSGALVRAGVRVLGAVGRLLPKVSAELAGRFSAGALTKPLVAPLLRASLRQTMEKVGRSFIVGETIESALARGKSDASLALCSFDVLGEGARTDADAERYFELYDRAIDCLRSQPAGTPHERSSISIKLSALEPRYSLLQGARVRERLIPRVSTLARKASEAGVGLTIDAEEADRLDLSLDVLEALARDSATRAWSGLGLAVQAYGRRSSRVIDWVAALARATGRKMTVRLVKGAYWDTEIKLAQERGLTTFPVYTNKAATDASYLVCAQRLFAAADVIYPQFATHNALTIATVIGLAPPRTPYEFQRLHGMGEALYEIVRADVANLAPIRVYAPVGTYEDLLPYLVRRLLENGANSSFVHQLLNAEIPVEEVVRDPISTLVRGNPPARVREPPKLYADRPNSQGLDWGNPAELEALQTALRAVARRSWPGGPVLGGRVVKDAAVAVVSPANSRDTVGYTRDASESEIDGAMEVANRAQPAWDATPASERAACLERAADLLEARRTDFISLLAREAGRTLPDAVAEVREAADFCRYYAARGRAQFGAPQVLQGPTGEQNELSLHGRGVFVCISPWNFPLAIFTGQIVAALVAGNSVVAKPAPATPLIAHAMTLLLHDAGIPKNVLQLTPADGPAFGQIALVHPALAGVAFTGSTATAATINRALAHREGPIVPLIAETGGVNAMIVDATALPEQVVDDVVSSAFTSAGQRCSALRVLYLQDEIADRVLQMLTGAMQCLVIGDPSNAATDVGPVISEAAQRRLAAHADRMRDEAALLYACALEPVHEAGHFFPPHLFQLRTLDQLRTEEFGPILHVARYRSGELPQVLEAIRKSGYGLTLGVHSRIEAVAAHVAQAAPVGNTYVNRNMIGAVVGVQPFGGQGLSGTGPKAGGPHYLLRFATERTLTVNTAAIGGNVELLA